MIAFIRTIGTLLVRGSFTGHLDQHKGNCFTGINTKGTAMNTKEDLWFFRVNRCSFRVNPGEAYLPNQYVAFTWNTFDGRSRKSAERSRLMLKSPNVSNPSRTCVHTK